METLEAKAFTDPFPHLIIEDLYNPEELDLIWEELTFYTKPNKLLTAKNFGGIAEKTNSHALFLDRLYTGKYRTVSNILTVTRKVFDVDILESFSKLHDCCGLAPIVNYDVTKVRYYHNGEYYQPHVDASMRFLIFTYFNKEPKKFSGGQLYFPKYDYEFPCNNNSMILFPSWVLHGVREVKIDDSNYYSGWGRYAITHFLRFMHKGYSNENKSKSDSV